MVLSGDTGKDGDEEVQYSTRPAMKFRAISGGKNIPRYFRVPRHRVDWLSSSNYSPQTGFQLPIMFCGVWNIDAVEHEV